MNTQLDHLIVAAATLAEGVAWCEEVLGVTPGPGGQHPLMGTHNRLLKIATPTYPDAYFEIIALDPQAAPPQRVRWFGLDEPALRERIAKGPRLIHAVARSTQLDVHRLCLLQVGLQPGVPIKAGRNTPQGPLAWQMLLRDDGRLLCGGAPGSQPKLQPRPVKEPVPKMPGKQPKARGTQSPPRGSAVAPPTAFSGVRISCETCGAQMNRRSGKQPGRNSLTGHAP